MSCLAGDVDEGGAAAEGSCPRMGFGECLLQDGIRGRNCLTCDDPGLDPPPFEGEGPRDQAKLWRERVGGNTEGCRQRNVKWIFQLLGGLLDPEMVQDTLGVLLKHQDDIAKLQGGDTARLLDELRAKGLLEPAGAAGP